MVIYEAIAQGIRGYMEFMGLEERNEMQERILELA